MSGGGSLKYLRNWASALPFAPRAYSRYASQEKRASQLRQTRVRKVVWPSPSFERRAAGGGALNSLSSILSTTSAKSWIVCATLWVSIGTSTRGFHLASSVVSLV